MSSPPLNLVLKSTPELFSKKKMDKSTVDDSDIFQKYYSINSIFEKYANVTSMKELKNIDIYGVITFIGQPKQTSLNPNLDIF
jgi:hypothetical protein